MVSMKHSCRCSDSQGVKADADPWIRHTEDLAALRGIPGVTAAVAVDTLPLGGSESSTGACASSEAMEAAIKANSIDRSIRLRRVCDVGRSSAW